eukprot:TRINITY_DN9745_c1_g1_i1.p2 TRINITY_DN9745_c1_g1~~TRINITY_DN9745_c1_g1_i1.p2  ORF type:complete len:177 (-),score=3.63 TRINITY_DN9745_c1_g1_i1:4217-4747(-)
MSGILLKVTGPNLKGCKNLFYIYFLKLNRYEIQTRTYHYAGLVSQALNRLGLGQGQKHGIVLDTLVLFFRYAPKPPPDPHLKTPPKKRGKFLGSAIGTGQLICQSGRVRIGLNPIQPIASIIQSNCCVEHQIAVWWCCVVYPGADLVVLLCCTFGKMWLLFHLFCLASVSQHGYCT